MNRRDVFSPGASQVPFDKTNLPSISAENIQDFLEEIYSKQRFVITTFFNGNVMNNQWLGYNDLLPGNLSVIPIPINCRLKEIAVSFATANVDGRIDIYKNGTNNLNKIVNNLTLTNISTRTYFTGINQDFVPGDYFISRWVDTGDNPTDLAITYFFQPL